MKLNATPTNHVIRGISYTSLNGQFWKKNSNTKDSPHKSSSNCNLFLKCNMFIIFDLKNLIKDYIIIF